LRSTTLFSASIAASLPADRSLDLAEPVVADDPDELPVPALLVPGGGSFPNLPLRFNHNAILLVPRRNNFR
jgi:hypothetical protein